MIEPEAYYFDFDETLTTQHVREFGRIPPTENECIRLMKNGAIDTLRQLIKRNHHVAIITNGNEYRIPLVLKGAGLRDEEIKKIFIRAANNPDIIVPNFKPKAIKDLAFNRWSEAKNHYFYDDRELFCQEVRTLIPEFQSKDKNLLVEQVSYSNCAFLDKIREKMNSTNGLISNNNEITYFKPTLQDTDPLVTKTGENNCCTPGCHIL